jgi:YbgC/YbaW family acyl-CoA thioester hydrolase
MEVPDTFHFTHHRLVEFADTDLAGIVHFANFLTYVENAEHAFFRSLGFRVHTAVGATHQGWPRLEVSCKYLKPARFEETLAICLRIQEMRTNSLTYGFWIFGPAAGPRALLATGTCAIIHVAIDAPARQLRKTPIPADLRRALEQAPLSVPPAA